MCEAKHLMYDTDLFCPHACPDAKSPTTMAHLAAEDAAVGGSQERDGAN